MVKYDFILNKVQHLKKEKIGNVLFYIASSDCEFQKDDSPESYLQTTSGKSGFPSGLKDAISALASGLFDNIGNQLNELQKPSEVRVDLSLTFSEKANSWIIGLQGDQKIGITLIWKKNV